MSFISLNVAKEYLQISHAAEDTILQIVIDSVEEWIQLYCGILLVGARNDQIAAQLGVVIDGNEVTENVDGGGYNLWPSLHPMTAITSVTDRDTDDAVTASDYRANARRIFYESGARWDRGPQKWQVVYEAGWTDATIPSGLKLAILDGIYRAYKKRGGEGRESAAGLSKEWEDLFGSDFIGRLRAFRFSEEFG